MMRERARWLSGADNLHIDGLRKSGDNERVPALVCPVIKEM